MRVYVFVCVGAGNSVILFNFYFSQLFQRQKFLLNKTRLIRIVSPQREKG